MPDQLPFRIRRSAVEGKRPQLEDLELGELALNTYDGRLFAKKDTGGVGIGTTIVLLTPWTENSGGSIYYNDGNIGIGTTNPSSKLTVQGDGYFVGVVTATNFYVGTQLVGGAISGTNLVGTSLSISGISTSGSYYIGTSQVISSDRQIQNITSLDAITTETIENAIQQAPNDFTSLNISGISTLGTVKISSGIISATTGIITYYGDAANLTKTFPLVTNVLYVSRNGNDSNPGTRLSEPKRTIAGAVAAATEGTVIKVSAGTYIENNPITLPDQISIVGDSLREVTITPQNDGDLFYIGAGNYIAEMSFVGAANTGAIFSFDPNSIRYIAQSPYIQNCTNFIPNSTGLKIDGNNAIGPLKSMVLDSYTQYNQGGIGVSITNEGYAQLVSLFTICNDVAVYCGSGAACDLTNSNSSFGNYGLIGDGVGPKKYTGIVTVSADSNADTFVLDLNTPTLDITDASYDNTTGILKAYTSTPHNFSVGMGVSIAGLGFTCPYEPGIRYYPSGQKGYIFEIETVAPGRYLDASNLIVANKTEIVDKSLASIALNHPDFVFLGDSPNDASYRYKDSYRLIQQNKQEIVDKSLASIAIGFPSAFNFPTDPVPYKQNRYYDASRLIQINKQEIIDKSLAAIAIDHPDFYFPSDSDMEINNVLTFRFRYYDAYRLIQKNRDVIVDTAWANTVDAYPGISTTQTKCKRDIGFFVDAVSTDVFTGGTNYVKQFTLQYFNAVGSPIPNGLVGEETESIFAFQQVRNLMRDAITNNLVGATYTDVGISSGPRRKGVGSQFKLATTDPEACSDVQDAINTLTSIVTISIGAGNTDILPSDNNGIFTPGGSKCARDLGYLVDALATDVFTGGNAYAKGFALQYFDNSGNPISDGLLGETSESITAFNAARDYAKKAVSNQLNVKNLLVSAGLSTYAGIGSTVPVDQSGNANACADVQNSINTLASIITTTIGAGNTSSLPSTNLGISTTNKCARDIGYFVDAVSTDLFTGGNSYVIGFTKQYFTAAGAATTALLGETSQSVYAFNSVRDYAKKAITNQLNAKDLTVSSGPATYDGVGNISVDPSGNAASCADVQSTINTLVGISTQAIGAGNLNILNNITINGGIFLDGQSKCRRDIGYIVDAVASDVRNYTNESIIEATKIYFDNSGNPLNIGITTSITAFQAVRDYSKLAITNQLNAKDLTLIGDPTNTDPLSCANVQSNIDNLVGILINQLDQGDLIGLPSISMPSTVFTMNVGVATQPHNYVPNTGNAKLNVIRPFDGQVVYFDELYYTVDKIIIEDGGSGYTSSPTVTISSPEAPWGIDASAVADVSNGSLTSIEIISNGRGFSNIVPTVTISAPNFGLNTAKATAVLVPTYYSILSSTPVSSGICTITVNDNLPYGLSPGDAVPFFKQSRVLASGHSFEYIGSGTQISSALPSTGGVPVQENETEKRNGGLVVYTSTDQTGNFRIGDGVLVNQQTGTISGTFYSKSLFSTMTPFILALGGR